MHGGSGGVDVSGRFCRRWVEGRWVGRGGGGVDAEHVKRGLLAFAWSLVEYCQRWAKLDGRRGKEGGRGGELARRRAHAARGWVLLRLIAVGEESSPNVVRKRYKR